MANYYLSSSATGSGTGTSGSPWTLQQAATGLVAGDIGYVKADGTYALTSNLTFSANFAPGSSGYATLEGYTTTPGDGGKATGQISGSATTVFPLSSNSGWQLRNLICDCNNVAASIGINLNQYGAAYNCKVLNFKGIGVKTSGFCRLRQLEITAGVSGATAAIQMSNYGSHLTESYIHDNLCTGVAPGTSNLIDRNYIVNNTGSSSHGIDAAGSYALWMLNNVIDGNGGSGINISNSNLMGWLIRANLLTRNGAYGMRNSSPIPAIDAFDGNFYYSNTSGGRSNSGTGTKDVTLTALPYTNPTAGDWSLNATAGGGAAVRNALQIAFPALSNISYLDGGASQHQDSGGGFRSFSRSMNGGYDEE